MSGRSPREKRGHQSTAVERGLTVMALVRRGALLTRAGHRDPQIATNALLDLLRSSLVSTGYSLFAVRSCDAISQLQQRASIVSALR
jgi:hypothetical protein